MAVSRAAPCFVVVAVVFRSFISVLSCPSCSGHPERTDTLRHAKTRGGGSPTRLGRAERSGGLHETKRRVVEEAWGNPSGGGRARVGPRKDELHGKMD